MQRLDWLSERILFGLILILGYYGLVIVGMYAPSKEALQLARDSLLVVGPIIGLIAASIWKTDKAERQAGDTLNSMAKSLEATTQAPPPPDPSTTQGT